MTELPEESQLAEASATDVWYRCDDCGDDLADLACNGERVAGPAPLSEIRDAFRSHVALRVAERAPDFVFVHAGVVSWRGYGLVFPGYSFSGKTTLVAEFVRAGALYFSDEYAVLDRQGRVLPFPRPLQVRAPGESRQTPTRVGDLGGMVGAGPIDVRLVAFATYLPDARWAPREVSAGRAVLELFGYTMSARRAPETALDALLAAVRGARLLKGTRGEAAQMIEFVAAAFEK